MSATSVSAAFLLGGYEFIRVAADSLFISAYGAAQRPHVMVVSAIVTIGFVYIFSRLLSFVGSLKALMCTFLIALGVFVLDYLIIASGIRFGVVLFYLFSQSYIVILFEQYWSFIDSILKKEEAKTYNGPIIGITSAGTITAGWIIKKFAASLGTKMFILLGAASMIPSLALFYFAYKMAGEPKPEKGEKEAGGGTLHLSLFRTHSTLLYLALVIALSQGLSTVVQLNYLTTIERSIPLEDARTAFMGNFWMMVSVVSGVFQFIVAPVLLRFFSLRAAMALIPCVHLLIGAAMFGSGSLTIAALAYGGFKVVDYSLFRAGKEVIYIPFGFDVRYRAKQVIDAIVYRFSKGMFSGLFSMYAVILGSVPRITYPVMSVIISLSWLAAVFPLTKTVITRPSGAGCQRGI